MAAKHDKPILSIHGSYGQVRADLHERWPAWYFHDSAAALLVAGKPVYASEEERRTRIKHTNKFPFHSIRHALEFSSVTADQIWRVAIPIREEFANDELRLQSMDNPSMVQKNAMELTLERLMEATGRQFAAEEICFVRHHDAHARIAWHDSGFNSGLVAIVDGQGEDDSISVYQGNGTSLNLLKTYTEAQSLGHLYSMITQIAGYGLFDEYKVMGLAPYGDAARFRSIFDCHAELLEGGEFRLDRHALRRDLMANGIRPRHKSAPFDQVYRDLAAAAQVTLERLLFHVLGYWKTTTRTDSLCLAGGVAHNCSANGKLRRLELFSDLFVHPAAHDAGSAIGAGLEVWQRHLDSSAILVAANPRRVDPFLGDPIPAEPQLRENLNLWSALVTAVKCGDVVDNAAQLLADGKVIAWVQGRSEFGPRALGNRSIVADPRPSTNKDRINAMIKKRESYRPFAPAVLEEHSSTYFCHQRTRTQMAYMNVTALVRDEYKDVLGAITHIDGTARLQTVSREDNTKFYELISAFATKTGVPILLNTSFNNYAEPIVNTVDEAVQCLLTTELDGLVIGDFVVSRRQDAMAALATLVPSIAPGVEVRSRSMRSDDSGPSYWNEIRWRHKFDAATPLSTAAYDVLVRADGITPLWRIIANNNADEPLLRELYAMWEARLIQLRPDMVHSS